MTAINSSAGQLPAHQQKYFNELRSVSGRGSIHSSTGRVMKHKTGSFTGRSVNESVEKTLSSVMSEGLQKTGSVSKNLLNRGVQLNKLFQPKLANYLVFGGLMQFGVTLASAATASAATTEVVGEFCTPTVGKFKEAISGDIGLMRDVVNSNGTDGISSLATKQVGGWWNRPDKVASVGEFLLSPSPNIIKKGVVSTLPDTLNKTIGSSVNAAYDQGVSGALDGVPKPLTLGGLLEDKVDFSGRLPDYVTRYLSADCVPRNAYTKGCDELTQKDFVAMLGDALGRDTPLFDGEGTTTGLTAQLEFLKKRNPELAEAALQWLYDPHLLKKGVEAYDDKRILQTIMEYAKDRYKADGVPRTIFHVECCETKPDMPLMDYQKAAGRPACLSSPASFTSKEQVVSCTAVGATGSLILGGTASGVALSAGVAAGFSVYNHYCRNQTQTAEGHVRLPSNEAGSSDPMVVESSA